MSKKTIPLSSTHCSALAAILHSQLSSSCGENWKKIFLINKKGFARPVKANLYFDARDNKLSRKHAINMILGKTHDKSPAKIVALLESIEAISSGEAMEHFNRIKGSMTDKRSDMIESILMESARAA